MDAQFDKLPARIDWREGSTLRYRETRFGEILAWGDTYAPDIHTAITVRTPGGKFVWDGSRGVASLPTPPHTHEHVLCSNLADFRAVIAGELG